MACPLTGGREVEQNQVQLHPLYSLDFLGSDPLMGKEQGREYDSQVSRGLH